VRQRLFHGLVRWWLPLCLTPFLSFGSLAFAQQLGSGVISGEVFDPQNAVVRGAQVIVMQKSTGVDRIATTNAAGLFALNNLAPEPMS
jgi:hypothetical protein